MTPLAPSGTSTMRFSLLRTLGYFAGGLWTAWGGRKRIEARQLRNLRRLVEKARRDSPLFRRLYADLGPSSEVELRELPVTRKPDLMSGVRRLADDSFSSPRQGPRTSPGYPEAWRAYRRCRHFPDLRDIGGTGGHRIALILPGVFLWNFDGALRSIPVEARPGDPQARREGDDHRRQRSLCRRRVQQIGETSASETGEGIRPSSRPSSRSAGSLNNSTRSRRSPGS